MPVKGEIFCENKFFDTPLHLNNNNAIAFMAYLCQSVFKAKQCKLILLNKFASSMIAV